MNSEERRKLILERMRKSGAPITGGALAAELGVTRQIVVSDIALLRAGGEPIVATPSGYMLFEAISKGRHIKVFSCRHSSVEDAEKELLLIVENGGTVRDVIIEHPVYGEITGSLMISTREAALSLVCRLRQKNSRMLSSVTDGVHMHTVEASDEETLKRIEDKLKCAGIAI